MASESDFNWLTSCLRSCTINEDDKTYGFPVSCGMAIGTQNDIFGSISDVDDKKFIIKSYNKIKLVKGGPDYPDVCINNLQSVYCKTNPGEIELTIRLYCMKDGKCGNAKSCDINYDGGDIELYIDKQCLSSLHIDKIRITHFRNRLS